VSQRLKTLTARIFHVLWRLIQGAKKSENKEQDPPIDPSRGCKAICHDKGLVGNKSDIKTINLPLQLWLETWVGFTLGSFKIERRRPP